MLRSSKSNGKAAANLVSLATIQLSNALIPVLVFPFALYTLGQAAYAELAIAEAVSVIVLTAVLFSFEIDGVAGVVSADPDKSPRSLSRLLSTILVARLLLFGGSSAVVLTAYAALTPNALSVLALWLLVPMGQVFYSYWFFQGIADNSPAAVITILSRLVSLGWIYMSVDGPEDINLLPLAIGLPFAIGGIVSLLFILRRYDLRLEWPGWEAVKLRLWLGKEIFAGNIAVMLYRDLNVVLLGVAGVGAAGISAYSLAEKGVKMMQAATRPLSQFFFPRLLRALKWIEGPSPHAARTVTRFTAPQLAGTLVLVVAVFCVYVVAQSAWPRLADRTALPIFFLAVMTPSILFGVANFMFGVAGLNYLGERGYLFKAILLTGIVSATLCLLLGYMVGALGAALCFSLAEAILFGAILMKYRRHRSGTTHMASGELK